MPTESHSYKRLVIGFHSSASDSALRVAVNLAELLDLELFGLFFDDSGLRDLASFPFAREFRPLDGGWHAIELASLSHDIESTVRRIERMFTAVAKNVPAGNQFEVLRGPLAATLKAVARLDDIMAVLEPVSPPERASQQFSSLVKAATQSAAAVLTVPSRIARTSGPIVAVAAGPRDPSLDAAGAIARAAGEQLIVIDVGNNPIDEGDIRARGKMIDRPIHYLRMEKEILSDPEAVPRVLRPYLERLLVGTRGVVNDSWFSATASIRGIPVLAVEPEKQITTS